MFNLDGRRSRTSRAAQAILDYSGLPIDRGGPSFALTLYQNDPVDNDYPYIIAHAGLRDPEPMYGPYNRSDFRSATDRDNYSHHRLGFRSREGVVVCKALDQKHWRLFVNAREPDLMSIYDRQIGNLVFGLTELLGEAPRHPLYPDLWYEERKGRDAIREKVLQLRLGTPLEELLTHLTTCLSLRFHKWLPGAGSIELAIYLKTREGWQLCGRRPTSDLPRIVPASRDVLNAFDWVAESARPILLDCHSTRWQDRLARTGSGVRINDGSFAGMCIVPLSHPQHGECMGLVLFIATNKHWEPKPLVFPAHLYLLSRLAMAVSTYTVPLLIPGFRWLPNAKMDRGQATIAANPPQAKPVPEFVESIVTDLMPTGSTVRITTLETGHTEAEVFRLDVMDRGKLPEIPRVLKLGPIESIEEELDHYYHYVHNKRVGGASRLDIARGFVFPGGSGEGTERKRGAIIYTFVGSGEKAEPWSVWTGHASLEDISAGFAMLYDQVFEWYLRGAPSATDQNVVALMIEPLANGGLKSYIKEDLAVNPSLKEVTEKLQEITHFSWGRALGRSRTCVVHGDLHSDNLFAILLPERGMTDGLGEEVERIRDVALIDWGSVKSGRHPLTDISKLAVDLAFRVRVRDVDWLLRHVEDWGRRLGCGPHDWKFAVIHQVAKALFYNRGSDNGQPYWEQQARSEAWAYVLALCGELMALRRARAV